MKITTDRPYHLTYCTNIHPGETWEEVRRNLAIYLPPLKSKLSPHDPFGIGLRLSDKAAQELLKPDVLTRFDEWLSENGFYVAIINGFPYGGFHRRVVKDDVYKPDWRSRDRVSYTLRLADILSTLLPFDVDGGISTAPLSYKGWLDESARRDTFEVGSIHLAEVAAHLVQIHENTGKIIHIDIEPEPDCLIENTQETIDFYQNWILPLGGTRLVKLLGLSRDRAEQKLLEHIRVCYDTCHFAVEYEHPDTVFGRMEEAGIRIGRIQISAALKIILPDSPEERGSILEHLRDFAESTYLHQVVERRADHTLNHYPDLPQALIHIHDPDAREWRIHYHVPVFTSNYSALESTQADIIDLFNALHKRSIQPHLEIETYTWEVLPPSLKLDVLSSIQREYDWVMSTFTAVHAG